MEQLQTIEILKALFKIQVEMPAIKKSGNNTFFKSPKNPDGSPYILLEDILEACKPLEKEHQVLVMHSVIAAGDERLRLKTSFTHCPSGQFIEVFMPLVTQKQDMQGMASAITYAKRQNIACVYNIQSEIDDDGNGSVIDKASSNNQKPKEPQLKKTYEKKTEYFFSDGKYKGKHFSELGSSDFDKYYLDLSDLVANNKANLAVIKLLDLMSIYKNEKGTK